MDASAVPRKGGVARVRRRLLGRGALRLVSCALLLTAASAAQAQVGQVVAGSALYVRRDSDRTTVIAPRLHVGAPVGDTHRVDLVYTADVWTSASIDIRTSASKAVTEQRDEIDATLSHEANDVALAGTYRFSHEPDYVSHGGSLGASFSLADKSSTIDLRLSGAFDDVGRAGDPGFERAARNLGARAGFTQLLDGSTFVQVFYELMSAHGYNSSPYRYVGFGTSNGLCKDPGRGGAPAFICLPESNPSERLRHAFAANFRRALGDSLAFGLEYRFYLDDWDVMSHTAQGELDWSVESDLILSLRYRFYMQTSAKHYQSAYEVIDTAHAYFTNDKELSEFSAHRVALDLEKDFELDQRGHKLGLVLSGAPSLFLYKNYRPLDQITAIEVTLAAVLKL